MGWDSKPSYPPGATLKLPVGLLDLGIVLTFRRGILFVMC